MARPQEAAQPEYIQGVVNYLKMDTEAPASYGGLNQKEADRKRRGNYESHTVTIHNARLLAAELSLEREGFVLVRHDTRMKDFYDEEEVRTVYYKETEELVKKTSGAKRVVVFDHTLRSGDEATREAKQVGGPVRGAHNDYTDWSGPQRVRDILPDEAEELLQGRFGVIQTWRPINRPVVRDPLAICDARQHRHGGRHPHRAHLPGPARRDAPLHLQSQALLVLLPAHGASRSRGVQDFRVREGRPCPLDPALRLRRPRHAARRTGPREHRNAHPGVLLGTFLSVRRR